MRARKKAPSHTCQDLCSLFRFLYQSFRNDKFPNLLFCGCRQRLIGWSFSSVGWKWASTSWRCLLIVALILFLDAVVTLQIKVNVVGITAMRWFLRSSPKCSTSWRIKNQQKSLKRDIFCHRRVWVKAAPHPEPDLESGRGSSQCGAKMIRGKTLYV